MGLYMILQWCLVFWSGRTPTLLRFRAHMHGDSSGQLGSSLPTITDQPTRKKRTATCKITFIFLTASFPIWIEILILLCLPPLISKKEWIRIYTNIWLLFVLLVTIEWSINISGYNIAVMTWENLSTLRQETYITDIPPAHDVVPTLNQRQWRWLNGATTSCAWWDHNKLCP